MAEILAVHTAGPNTLQISYEHAGSDEECDVSSGRATQKASETDHSTSADGEADARVGVGTGAGVAEELKFECHSTGQLVGELGRRIELARHIVRKRTRLQWTAFDSKQFQKQVPMHGCVMLCPIMRSTWM